MLKLLILFGSIIFIKYFLFAKKYEYKITVFAGKPR